MSATRKNVIDKAFDKLDKTGDGEITYEEKAGVCGKTGMGRICV